MRGKTKKRLLSALLAAALVSGLWIPAPAAAESPVTGSVTAAVRIDYAQRLDELQRRDLRLELRRGGQTLGTVPLAQEGEHLGPHLEAAHQISGSRLDGLGLIEKEKIQTFIHFYHP